MDLASNNLTELYSDVSFSYGNVIFRRGEFYGIPAAGGHYVKVNKLGVEETIPVPASGKSFQLKFSRNKIFAIVSDPGPDMRIEVYSKSL